MLLNVNIKGGIISEESFLTEIHFGQLFPSNFCHALLVVTVIYTRKNLRLSGGNQAQFTFAPSKWQQKMVITFYSILLSL